MGSRDVFKVPHYRPEQFKHLSEKQQKRRILFSLEKLNSLNETAFPMEEKNLLAPTNPSIIYYVYHTLLGAFNKVWFMHLFISRSFNRRYMGRLFAFTALNYLILRDLPLRIKEIYRRRTAMPIVEKYLSKHHGNMEKFNLIIDPRTSLFDIEHMTL